MIATNAYRCDCDYGFSGVNCDIFNECLNDPCYQLTTTPPFAEVGSSVTATDKFLCPVAMICTDPDHTTTDDYTCTCPACDDAMFSTPNVATLSTYLATHSGLRYFISSALTEQAEDTAGTQQTCQLTDTKCAFGPTGLCPDGCAYSAGTSACAGVVASTTGNCAAVAAFVASGLETDCPTTDGCSFTGTPATCTARLGCTNPIALNYDDRAALDDGSCIVVVYGCMDLLAVNYDGTATKYDPTGANGELCKAGYCSITGEMPECPAGCTGPVAAVCSCGVSPDTSWVCPNTASGQVQSIQQYSVSNPLDECAQGSPCTNPGTRLCPLLALRGMTPTGCANDRQAFVCPDDTVGGSSFQCNDPNPYWPGDYTCDCVYAHEGGFYDSTASLQCGQDEVLAGLTNYEFSRLVDTLPSLRTR